MWAWLKKLFGPARKVMWLGQVAQLRQGEVVNVWCDGRYHLLAAPKAGTYLAELDDFGDPILLLLLPETAS